MSNELLAVLITIGITAVIFTGDLIIDVIKYKRAKKKKDKENERIGNSTKLQDRN